MGECREYHSEFPSICTELASIRNRILVTSGVPGASLQLWQMAEDSGE